METNLILNVKCTNKHLLNYINDLINKKEYISGLEISLYTKTPTKTKSLNDNIQLKKSPDKNINDNKSVYDGGWVDMEDKHAVQKMFDAFRI